MVDASRNLVVRSSVDRVAVFADGREAPILVQNATAHRRPFIHPIIVPAGRGTVTEDAPAHHPWQHGLYVGLNDVNGFGYWSEGLVAEDAATDGTFHPIVVGPPAAHANQATWDVFSEYRDPHGQPILHETQRWTLTNLGPSYDLDLRWTLHADEGPVDFGRYDYGGLFLRMPYRHDAGGNAFNSAGQQGTEADGQRARWVAVRMPIAGEVDDAVVAIMDHPSNLEHPVPWRVDDELGVAPSVCIAGPWRIEAGEDRQFRYRVAVFGAPVPTPTIDAGWLEFSAGTD